MYERFANRLLPALTGGRCCVSTGLTDTGLCGITGGG